MKTLVLALITVRNQHRHNEESLPEPKDFQPFDLQALRNSYKAKNTPSNRAVCRQQLYTDRARNKDCSGTSHSRPQRSAVYPPPVPFNYPNI
jgi:hypothetical protein